MVQDNSPVSGSSLVETLTDNGFYTFTGVPCSYVSSVIESARNSDRCEYVIASNEGASLAIAAGRYLTGRLPVVLLQNSGFGNLLNPLTSLTLIYQLGGLMLITMRAYPDGMKDEPQHRLIGRELTAFLSGLDVDWRYLPESPEELADAAALAAERAREGRITVWLVPKNSIAGTEGEGNPPFREMSRQGAIEIVAGAVGADDLIVGSTGMIGRELFMVSDRPGNFYMQGSMGHAINIGLGLCGNDGRKVIVLDGDGALLMHMGSLSTVGYYRPHDLIHVVLDNETYGTTGNQQTTSPTTDFVAIATACGYVSGTECTTAESLGLALREAFRKRGPHLIRVKVSQAESASVPRVTDRYTPEENTRRVTDFAVGPAAG